MLKSGESLYFLALVPPAEIQENITQFKNEIAEKYGSSHALKSPPHITLHMPFRWKDKRTQELYDFVNSINHDLRPFEIQLKDFDFFEPRVVFVNVIENQTLENLQKEVTSRARKELKLDNANYRNRAFHPHVTIGFRDLKKPAFYEARKEFEERRFSEVFRVREIALLKHDGEKWEVVYSPN